MTQTTDPIPTKHVLTDVTFLSVLVTAIATVWQQSGWHADWLGQFNTVAPLVLQILGGLGIVGGHAATISAPAKQLTILPGAKDTAAPLLALGGLCLAFLTGCPPVPPPTTQPVTTQPAAPDLGPSRAILTAERFGYALAAVELSTAHAKGQITGLEYNAALAGLAGLKQRIADNTATVAAGHPIDLSNADNAFNAALDDFLANLVPVPTP